MPAEDQGAYERLRRELSLAPAYDPYIYESRKSIRDRGGETKPVGAEGTNAR